jgi:hypothetical protein
VWPPEIIIGTPGSDDPAGCGETAEQTLVQALVAEPADEALGKGVLDRLAGSDVVPLHAPLLRPAEDGVGQLGAVVTDDRRRPAAPGDQLVEFAGHALAGDPGVDDQPQTLPAEVVKHAQDPEATPIAG